MHNYSFQGSVYFGVCKRVKSHIGFIAAVYIALSNTKIIKKFNHILYK